jgi:hypothetical protein
MRRENDFPALWALFLVPIAGASLTHCTLSGLDALGEGPQDAQGESSASQPPSGDGAREGSTGDVDAGGLADADATVSPEAGGATPDGSEAAVDDADIVSAPASAPAVFLDAGTSSWCDTHPVYSFCDDFDKSPLPSRFSASDGPYLFQTSSSPSSAPNDLLLYVPAQGGSGSWGSKLSVPFGAPASSIVMEFDIDPAMVNPGSSGLLFAAIDFTSNAAAKYSLRLAYNAGSPRLEESYLAGGSDIYHANFALPANVWSRIQVAIAFSAGDAGADSGVPMTGTETIAVNGAQVQTQALTPPASFDQRPTFFVGAVYGTNPTSGWALRYDNVTFDIH